MKKNYCIMARTKEESELVIKSLMSYGIYDPKRENGLVINEFIRFKCKKKSWKKIKKELNLEVDEVFVSFKKEES